MSRPRSGPACADSRLGPWKPAIDAIVAAEPERSQQAIPAIVATLREQGMEGVSEGSVQCYVYQQRRLRRDAVRQESARNGFGAVAREAAA